MTRTIKVIGINLILFGAGFLTLLILYSNSSAFNFTSIMTISFTITGGVGLLHMKKYGWIFSNALCTNITLITIYTFIDTLNKPESLSHSGLYVTLLFIVIFSIIIFSVYYLNGKKTIELFDISQSIKLISFVLAVTITIWEIYKTSIF
ncbi:hypothetical protein [Fulvivirga sp.]|uniref:hypothetical protein n=1 Tax=Fulvivirga sp. TaxID=1931237 RepID=UPI0032ED62C7